MDIGIDESREGSRSPYYELELRVLDQANYPVEQRFWPPSPGRYEPEYRGPCP